MKIRPVIFALSIIISPVVAVYGQKTMPITDTIYSKILNEQRVVQVFLPDGADLSTKKKYDVLYVLDGEDFGEDARQILSFDRGYEYAPPMIVVSILNKSLDNNHVNSRNRDFLPVAVEGYAFSGGSDNFLSFLKSELIPLVDERYPTSNKNVLFGHSYGGLFALYALFTQPGVFRSYIASDPSLWWNDGYVNKLAIKNMGSITGMDITLYFAGRAGELFRVLGSYAMDSILKVNAPAGIRWKSNTYSNERHQSVKIKALYDGLKFTYFGYSPTAHSSYIANSLEFFPMDGILVKGKPVKIMTWTTFLDYEPGIRYTTDGSEPSISSPKFEFGMPISAPAVFTLKMFSTQGPDHIVIGHFVEGKTLPAGRLPKTAVGGAFNYAYYKGKWDDIPDFSALQPAGSGLAKTFIKDFIADTGNFACRITGYFQVVKNGYYTFFLQADEKARLYIGNQRLMNIDTNMDSLDNRSFVIPLEKGFYPIRIDYLHKSGAPSLRLYYVPPTDGALYVPPLSIPPALQYSTK